MWSDRLQTNYSTFEQWKAYSDMYGLAKRLGFKSARAAWNRNPTIQGSTNPSDFKVITTDVIFRMLDGQVIALFPADPGTNDPYTCSSYMHLGQHASADPHGVMAESRPATPAEYADLKAELERRGYTLVIRLRNRRDYIEIRRAAILETRAA